MASFEKAKQSFGTSGNDSFEIQSLIMSGRFSPDHYDEDEGAVILSK